MADPIQQQLVAARKNQILDAAVMVFAEKGFHATTIRNIARQAGIAEGTIYNYFDDKAALLIAILERMRASIIRDNPPVVSEAMGLRASIRAFLSHSLTLFREDNDALFRILMSEAMVNADLRRLYYERILAPTLAMADAFLLEQAIKHGLRLSPEDSRLIIRVISGAVMGLICQHMMDDETLVTRWHDLPDLMADLITAHLQQTG
jgi:TetR/AcrR family fatty acid metabolism transcriptional regulator